LRTHAYQVMEPFDYVLFEEDWRADEELLLLDGIASVGLGNWEDIGLHIGTRTADEVEAHYYAVYVDSPVFPLPHPDKNASPGFEKVRIPKRSKRQQGETDLSTDAPPLVSCPAHHEVAGYMPLRKEFETEYENDAEQAIKDIAFYEDDSAADVELKLAMLGHYCDVLDKRAERKRFILDHGFLDFKKVSFRLT
jgi:transcriptional adapter 2-alpha